MNNKPELEIFADDVLCAHGATCGAARRRPAVLPHGPRPAAQAEAESLLVQAFLGEAVEFVEHEARASEALDRRRRGMAEGAGVKRLPGA